MNFQEERPPAGGPRLHLTFDDGPHPVWTPHVLDRLARAGATATFFVLGAQVRRHPGLVEMILAAGHTVGLHGDAHLDHARAPAAEVVEDTRLALSTLNGLGMRVHLWRLPWGRTGPATAGLARRYGLVIVGWDHDTHDWRGDGPGDQPRGVRAAGHTGGVVLLHDGFGPGQSRTDAANTLELTGDFLRDAAASGVRVEALDAAVPR